MIINTGGRTDTVQYYTEWLLRRFSEGYVLSRNPLFQNKVTRYELSPDKVDCIVFCSKNYKPILPRLHEITIPIFIIQLPLMAKILSRVFHLLKKVCKHWSSCQSRLANNVLPGDMIPFYLRKNIRFHATWKLLNKWQKSLPLILIAAFSVL